MHDEMLSIVCCCAVLTLKVIITASGRAIFVLIWRVWHFVVLEDSAGTSLIVMHRCESLGVSSRMVVSVDLEIAPLNLSPWPSTGSIPSGAVDSADLGQKQVRP